MSASNTLHGERKAGMVGVPLPDVLVKIVDDAGNEVPNGSVGELLVKGHNVFSVLLEPG